MRIVWTRVFPRFGILVRRVMYNADVFHRRKGETAVGGVSMATSLRVLAHLLLFLVAVGIFFAGLGIGLTESPTLGTAMWGVAAVIAGLNLLWLVRWRRR